MFEKIKKLIVLIKKKFFYTTYQKSSIYNAEEAVREINQKIRKNLKLERDFIVLSRFENYFNLLQNLGLRSDFQLLTTHDSIILCGSIFRPLIINKNNEKLIIFCHGITSNRWGLFYCIHLLLQLGYQVVTYDFRSHGISGKSTSITPGKVEASDLEDVINWVQKFYPTSKIGLYGFSWGAASLLFWLTNFQKLHPEIKFLICEAPFDSFSHRLRILSGIKKKNELRNSYAQRLIKYFFPQFSYSLENNEPISILPDKLSLKLLLLHGTTDRIFSWHASYNIWKHFWKNPVNRQKVNCYFFVNAEHGEVPIISDILPGKIRWIKNLRQKSKFKTFTELLIAFLKKNF